MRPEVTDRQIEIIRAIVGEYILTGQPVGSHILVKKFGMDISSATVRKEMSMLEQMGMLRSPHTSAGRVPTDIAIQMYVEDLVQLYQLTLDEKARLDEFYGKARLQLDQLLQTTAQMLGMTSKSVGVVLAPMSVSSIIKRIELISVLDSLILVIMISESGSVFQKKLQVGRTVNQDELYRISRFLNHRLKGHELVEMRDRSLEFIVEEGGDIETSMDIALNVVQSLIYSPPDQQVHIDGEADLYRNLLEAIPDKDRAEELIKKFKDRNFICSMLNRVRKSDSVTPEIGIEIDGEKYECISVLAQSYSVGGRNVGALGVIGLNRMPYDRLIPAMDYSAKMLSLLLSEKQEYIFGENQGSPKLKTIPEST